MLSRQTSSCCTGMLCTAPCEDIHTSLHNLVFPGGFHRPALLGTMRDKFGNNGYHSHLAEEALSTTTASGDLCVSLCKLAKLQ